jgi:hypothetical protein
MKQESDSRAQGTNPRFPWEPSVVRLFNRLRALQFTARSTATVTASLTPTAAHDQGKPTTIFVHHGGPPPTPTVR